MCTEAKPIYLGAEPFLPHQWNTIPKYGPSYPGMKTFEGPMAGPYNYPTVGSIPEWKQMYPEIPSPGAYWQPPTTKVPGYPYPYTCKPEGEYFPAKPWETKTWEMKKPYGTMPWETKPMNMSYYKDAMCTKEPCYPYYQPEAEYYPTKPFGPMPWEVKPSMPMTYYKDTKEGSFPYSFRPEWFPTTYGPKPWENKTVFPGMPFYKEYIKDTCYPYTYKPEGEYYPSKPWETKPYGPFPMSTPVSLPYPPKSYPYEKTYPGQPYYGPMNKPFPPTMYPFDKDFYPTMPYGPNMYPLDQETVYPRKPFYGPVNKPYGPFPEYKTEPNWHGELPNQYTYGYGNFPNGQQSSVLGG
ncbi:hypothetical protein RvY_14811 [Ramazzottius varieornatus]|uniref:Uncharacterized protein n=1 Tax=Ramazzottius varieornatus TaxID=947166 RepID=A0A1D1VWA5_RAMVA|nr:hypothetical protein RvY_14811 [Ramazzottius varieornatus]